MRLPHAVALAGLCAACAMPAAGRADSAFAGRWHFDRAASTPPPAEAAPDDVVIDVLRADPDHLTWTLTVRSGPAGAPDVETFDAPGNGQFTPISADTQASFRLQGDALQLTFKGPAGQLDTMTCSLSPDKQRLTCRGALSDSDGRKTSYVDVYDRG